MIQVMNWIFLMCFISMATSNASSDHNSELLPDKVEIFASTSTGSRTPTTEILSNTETLSNTEIPSSAEILTSTETGSSEKTYLESSTSTDKIPENNPSHVKNISTISVISSSITEMPEPVYRGNKTVENESASTKFKESTTNANPVESSFVTFNENLYFVGKYSDKDINITVNPNSGSIASDGTVKSILENFTTEKLSEFASNLTTEGILSADTLSTEGTYFTTIIENNSDIDQNVDNVKSTETEENVMSQKIPTVLSSESLESGFITEKGTQNINENKDVKLETMTDKVEDEESQKLISATHINVSELPTSKNIATSFIFTEKKEVKDTYNISDELPKDIETYSDNIRPIDHTTTQISVLMEDNMTLDSTDTISNSTRNPKKILENEDRYPEGRIRPIHPDPGYANYGEKDTVRPYRPDSPIHQYPYYRPTPDYRTPIIREDKDYTKPSKPDSEFQRASFRPNYGYSKTSQEDTNSQKSFSVFSTSPKPYRPSFSRPSYHPQSSFGRPYRPDYHRPSSKPAYEYSVTKISEVKGDSTQDSDVSEHSRADYEYTKQYESSLTYTKNYNSDIRPSAIIPDLVKPYKPNYDSAHLKTTSPENAVTENRDTIKVSKPEINTNRPSSFYPRPVFGNKYQTAETSVKPFSVGTVTSAKNLTRVEFIKADCFDNHMKVTMRFNGTFNGLVYSSGYASDSSCSYVNGSGRNHYEFYIRLNRCGTLGQQEVAENRMRSDSRRRQERAQYLVNTVTVQYNPVIEEDIDEHFRVTCEYGYDFWKTVTFPILNVESSAVKVRTGNPVVFTLPPPQCNMEIRNGYGPSSPRVSGPVNVGDPLTLVIHMKSESTGFDILISNCYAHNGAQKRLQLIDSNGCVVEDKLVSPFRGVSSPDRSQQVTLYSYLKAFRFTGSPALYIECDVHMCHGSCPPQRCYWRHLYKRSANEDAAESTTASGNFLSESISLFQALEVRHEEIDTPHLISLRNPNGNVADDVVCLRSAGFAAILACLLLLLLTTTFAAMCMCLRIKKMKKLVESPDIKHFAEFDGHVPLK